MRTNGKSSILSLPAPSPARFLPATADIGDCEYVDGSEARSTLGDIFSHISKGELIAPRRAGAARHDNLSRSSWRPRSAPSD